MTTSSGITLVEYVEALSGQRLADCYQCGTCTAGCPVAERMDVTPSQAVRLLQLGRPQEVLESAAIWLCASCVVCGTRCPRDVDYARVAEACRAIVLRVKGSRLDPDMVGGEDAERIPQQAFVAGFRKFAS